MGKFPLQNEFHNVWLRNLTQYVPAGDSPPKTPERARPQNYGNGRSKTQEKVSTGNVSSGGFNFLDQLPDQLFTPLVRGDSRPGSPKSKGNVSSGVPAIQLPYL